MKPLDIALLMAWIEEVERSTPVERILFDWQGIVGPPKARRSERDTKLPKVARL